jgi:hypothetical protein
MLVGMEWEEGEEVTQMACPPPVTKAEGSVRV